MKTKSKPSKADVASSAPCFSEETKRAWLRLVRTPQIGGVTFWELLKHFGSAEAALDALPEFAQQGGRAHKAPSDAMIDAELERAEDLGFQLVATGEAEYPPLLAHVEAPPPLLYVKAGAAIWSRPPLAVVGSRQASAAGLKLAADLSAELGRRGFVIVSGLARGIDGAAHRAALPFATCAVLPGGLDKIYPPEHVGLAREIAECGMLVSECPPGFVARAVDFPRRNRIVSGSSLGVVVVEAAERSGSLITARLAGEQNREVFAVPGHPLEPRSSGTNRLIKEGANVVTSADDIVEALALQLACYDSAAPKSEPALPGRTAKLEALGGNTEAEQAASADAAAAHGGRPGALDFTGDASGEILRLLSLSPIDIDDLCRISGLEPRAVNAALLSLDLLGRIERRGPRQIALRP
jgi:DNA processing protein